LDLTYTGDFRLDILEGKAAMCDRCDAWEFVVGNWFGESLRTKLEEYIEQQLLARKPN